MDQLRELVARIASRPLDRSRPLWEVYFVEGLAEGRVALLTKSHQILVDGVETVDIGQVLLDTCPEGKDLERDDWSPRRTPSAAGRAQRGDRQPERPATLVSTARQRRVGGRQAAGAPAPGSPRSPTRSPTAAPRRPTVAPPSCPSSAGSSPSAPTSPTTAQIRRAHGGSVNDVILATVTGALRGWLMARGTSSSAMRQLKAIVPMSVIDDELEATSLGTQITGHLVTLPIGEPSPVVRLHQVSYAFKAHSENGRTVAANRLSGIAGFAPTTFHALGSRVAAEEYRKGFHLSITNVPGPQFPLYAAGAGCSSPTRSTRCCPATRWRSASRPTTGASSTASPPTATRCPTSSCSASA